MLKQKILDTLDVLGYKVAWRVLDARDFAVPQERKRIYIVGTHTKRPNLDDFTPKHATLANIIEQGLPTLHSAFIDQVLKNYPLQKLVGKSFKDKRGGVNNIHSWDIAQKGPVTDEEKRLLNTMLTERRKKKWAEDYGIDWMVCR